MNVFDEPGEVAIPDVNGQTLIEVESGVVKNTFPCSRDCVLHSLAGRKVTLIPLGGTRGAVPGIRDGNDLLMTNVFTNSRRSLFPVKRSLEIYREVVTRLQSARLDALPEILGICRCSTRMEYFDRYEIFDNKSSYTPPQHREKCWLDGHSVEEGISAINSILATAHQIHKLDILHTDITGFNILVGPKSRAKLVDLFSCVMMSSLWPGFLPYSLKRRIGLWLEFRQIDELLINPLRERWPERVFYREGYVVYAKAS